MADTRISNLTAGTPSASDVVAYTNGTTTLKSTMTNVLSAGSALFNVIEDTTPQLGGDLDLNGHEISGGGWMPLSDTWTFSSADAPTYVISVNADVTGIIGVGQKLKFTHSAATKYFIVTVVGAFGGGVTLITVYGGTDYTLAAGAITLPYYSMVKAPLGFPLSPAKWTEEFTDTTERSQLNPVNGTWYNIGSMETDIPIGVWETSYSVLGNGDGTGPASIALFMTLSTANNSQSDANWTRKVFINDIDRFDLMFNVNGKILTLAAKDTYYLNMMSDSSLGKIMQRNDKSTLVIRAACAYL